MTFLITDKASVEFSSDEFNSSTEKSGFKFFHNGFHELNDGIYLDSIPEESLGDKPIEKFPDVIRSKFTGIKFNEGIKLVRDVFGSKPVYYTEKEGNIFISDRIRPILEFRKSKVNKQVALDYLHSGLVNHKRETFFEGINQMRPREILEYQNNSINIQKQKLSSEPNQDIETLLGKEIEEKVPEGRFICPISGGLDSSIVSLKSGEADFFHASFDVETGDENYFEIMKEEINADINEVNLSIEKLIENIDESIKTLEKPSSMIAIQAQYLFYSKIKEEKGPSTIVDGTGADELFLGYPKFIPYYIAEELQKSFLKGLKAFKDYRYGLNYYLSREIIRILSSNFYSNSQKIPEINHRLNFEKPKSLEDARQKNLQVYDFPHILHSIDKNASKHEHEVKSAFLSPLLLAKSSSINIEKNFSEGKMKNIVREAFKHDLNKEILERKRKTGFIHPKNSFNSPDTGKKFQKVFSSKKFRRRSLFNGELFYQRFKRKKQNFFKCYRFYCFEKWMREFID